MDWYRLVCDLTNGYNHRLQMAVQKTAIKRRVPLTEYLAAVRYLDNMSDPGARYLLHHYIYDYRVCDEYAEEI